MEYPQNPILTTEAPALLFWDLASVVVLGSGFRGGVLSLRACFLLFGANERDVALSLFSCLLRMLPLSVYRTAARGTKSGFLHGRGDSDEQHDQVYFENDSSCEGFCDCMFYITACDRDYPPTKHHEHPVGLEHSSSPTSEKQKIPRPGGFAAAVVDPPWQSKSRGGVSLL